MGAAPDPLAVTRIHRVQPDFGVRWPSRLVATAARQRGRPLRAHRERRPGLENPARPGVGFARFRIPLSPRVASYQARDLPAGRPAAPHVAIEQDPHRASLTMASAPTCTRICCAWTGISVRGSSVHSASGSNTEPRQATGRQGPKGKAGSDAKAPRLRAWHIEREKFTVVPVYADGSHGPALNVRELFLEFQKQTS
jgi:hypothetical protein